jgi:hypothetical protein
MLEILFNSTSIHILEFANSLSGCNQKTDFRCRVVRRHILRLVAEEHFSILEAHTSATQSVVRSRA